MVDSNLILTKANSQTDGHKLEKNTPTSFSKLKMLYKQNLNYIKFTIHEQRDM
jgi:hypothetical protein